MIRIIKGTIKMKKGKLKFVWILLTVLIGIGWFGYCEITKSEISGLITPTDKPVVIFDFDGTICDSFTQFVQVFNGIAPYYNLIQVSEKDLADIHNYETEYIIKKHGVTSWTMPIVVYHVRRNMKQLIPTMKLYSGIRETIQKMISNGVVVGILTSNSQEVVHTFLKNNNLTGFQFIFTGSGIFGKAKNLKMIKDQLKSQNIFYVGDEVRDVKAAKEANIQSIAATWGFHSRKLLESSNPGAMADSPSDLMDIVEKSKKLP